MNLAEIELTPEQAREFIALLQERVEGRARLVSEREEEKIAYVLAERRYARIQELAKELATMHGRLIGIPIADQAQLTWDVFASGEGHFDRYDVDELFDPDDDEYEQGWIFAYTAALEARP